MGLQCGCPAGPALPDIETPECKESLGQVQKLLIQRIYLSAGKKNEITEPATKATWTPLLLASDGKKVIITPYIENPVTEPGGKRTFGSGNAVLGGIPKVIGTDPTAFTSMLYELPQYVVKELKKLSCEKIGVAFIDEYGRIAMQADDPKTPTKYSFFPVDGFFVGDKNLGGVEGVDGNALEFNLFPNWSDNLVIVTPSDFNALDLAKEAGGE